MKSSTAVDKGSKGKFSGSSFYYVRAANGQPQPHLSRALSHARALSLSLSLSLFLRNSSSLPPPSDALCNPSPHPMPMPITGFIIPLLPNSRRFIRVCRTVGERGTCPGRRMGARSVQPLSLSRPAEPPSALRSMLRSMILQHLLLFRPRFRSTCCPLPPPLPCLHRNPIRECTFGSHSKLSDGSTLSSARGRMMLMAADPSPSPTFLAHAYDGSSCGGAADPLMLDG